MLNILHLSDLQFGKSNHLDCERQGNICRYRGHLHVAIADALHESRLPGPHLIMVTGDIAETAEDSEYLAAFEFISGLHNRLKDLHQVTPTWLVIPGNHDVHRKSSKRVCEEGGDEDARVRATFASFTKFLGRLCAAHIPVNDGREESLIIAPSRVVFQVIISPPNLRGVDFQVIVAGLNSCEREGHDEASHRGYVSGAQLDGLGEFLRRHVSPWAFRIAVVHHNIALNAAPLDAFRSALKAAKVPVRSRKRLESWYGASLSDEQRVLNSLAELGFQLVLHGHQHYDGPIHLGLQQEPDNPVAHDGVSVVAAGSAGLVSGRDQPSVPSFEYYQVGRRVVSWEMKQRRFVIKSSGATRPEFRATPEKEISWSCYSSRPERILEGITRLFGSRRPAPQRWYPDHGPRATACLVTGYTFCDDSLLGIPADRVHLQRSDVQEWQRLWEGHTRERLGDLTTLVADTLASIFPSTQDAKPPGIYGDLEHLSLRNIAPSQDGRTYTLETDLTTYLHYHTTSLALHRVVGDAPFFESHIAKGLAEWVKPGGLRAINAILENTCYVSKRITIQAVIEVRCSTGNFALLKMRSDAVGHMRGRLQFAVGGGVKVSLFKGETTTFEDASRREIGYEVGLDRECDQMRVVCLTINRETLAPAFTLVVPIAEDDFAERFVWVRNQPIEVAGVRKEFPAYSPKNPPRDWWESALLVKYPIGRQLLLGTVNDSDGWSDLQALWNGLRSDIVDPYPGSAIAQIVSSLRSPPSPR